MSSEEWEPAIRRERLWAAVVRGSLGSYSRFPQLSPQCPVFELKGFQPYSHVTQNLGLLSKEWDKSADIVTVRRLCEGEAALRKVRP